MFQLVCTRDPCTEWTQGAHNFWRSVHACMGVVRAAARNDSASYSYSPLGSISSVALTPSRLAGNTGEHRHAARGHAQPLRNESPDNHMQHHCCTCRRGEIASQPSNKGWASQLYALLSLQTPRLALQFWQSTLSRMKVTPLRNAFVQAGGRSTVPQPRLLRNDFSRESAQEMQHTSAA